MIRAHRLVLSAGSGYLERVLAVTPCEHPTIVLSNIRYKELKLLIDFVYTGTSTTVLVLPTVLTPANCIIVLISVSDEEEGTIDWLFLIKGLKLNHKFFSDQEP
jgi:hypothetical protein